MNSKDDSANEADAATETATDEETVAEPAVDETVDESLDSEWYDHADAEDPFGPVADEYRGSGDSAAEPLDANETATVELPTEPIANQYEPYEELSGGDEAAATDGEATRVDETDAAVDHSRATEASADLPIDPALIRVIADWHQLSPESRQAILTLVQQDSLQPARGN